MFLNLKTRLSRTFIGNDYITYNIKIKPGKNGSQKHVSRRYMVSRVVPLETTKVSGRYIISIVSLVTTNVVTLKLQTALHTAIFLLLTYKDVLFP